MTGALSMKLGIVPALGLLLVGLGMVAVGAVLVFGPVALIVAGLAVIGGTLWGVEV
jgi:hypothetical protein